MVVANVCGCRVSVDVDASAARARVRTWKERAANTRPLLEHCAGIMRNDFREQFRAGGIPKAWATLSPNTVAAKRGMGLPGKSAKGRIFWRLKQQGEYGPASILIATGALRDSYGVKGAKGHIEKIDPAKNELVIGSALKIAQYHQYGTPGPYRIAPVAKKALAFMTSGGWTIRRSVMHPGLRARPVVVTDYAKSKMVEAMQRWLEGATL